MKTIAQQLNVKDFPFMITDANNNLIYWEGSNGGWCKREFDGNHTPIYCEDSDGYIIDNRPKPTPEYTMEELVAKLGFDFKIKK
jgi:hypothetical protein